MSRTRSILMAAAFATVAALMLGGCSESPPVKGKVIDTFYRASTFAGPDEWHASVELANGTVLGLETAGDEGLLKTKVHVGDCVLLKNGTDINIGNADNIVVYREKKDCYK
jgi:hypothetical protein